MSISGQLKANSHWLVIVQQLRKEENVTHVGFFWLQTTLYLRVRIEEKTLILEVVLVEFSLVWMFFLYEYQYMGCNK